MLLQMAFIYENFCKPGLIHQRKRHNQDTYTALEKAEKYFEGQEGMHTAGWALGFIFQGSGEGSGPTPGKVEGRGRQ